jgi:hypothetical protein
MPDDIASNLKRPPSAVVDGLVGLPLGFRQPMKRARIYLAEGSFADRFQDVWAITAEANASPFLYRSLGRIVMLAEDERGHIVQRVLEKHAFRVLLSQLINFQRERKGKGEVDPPMALINALLETQSPPLPVLDGVYASPVFGSAGALITRPGYHSDARIYFAPPSGFVVDPLPTSPTKPEVKAARQLIFDEIFHDFPFATQADLATAYALLLTPFLRPMIDGPLPLFMIEKPMPATGGSLLADAVHMLFTGRRMAALSQGEDDSEWRKRITAALLEREPVLVFDNLTVTLDTAALAQALTSTEWRDRILGKSETVTVPNKAVWIATGNNPTYNNDMIRRVVTIRLDAQQERPGERIGFKHPDLIGNIRRKRGALVRAALILCQGWISNGRVPGQRMLASFENWCRIVGGVLDNAVIPGLLGNRQKMMARVDSEIAAMKSFVGLWHAKHGAAEVGVKWLLDLAVSTEPPLVDRDRTEHSQLSSLGRKLRALDGRVFDLESGRVQVNNVGMVSGSLRWRLVELVDQA